MQTVNTSKVELLNILGNELTVVNAARVSFAKHVTVLSPTDIKLIQYLAKHKHWTPFAHVQLSFRIACPIFVARQWTKSTVGVTRNEVSRRYVDTPPEYYLPQILHSRPTGNIKQGAGIEHPRGQAWLDSIRTIYTQCHEQYLAMISDGIAPEEARMILPLAHFTEFYETGSLVYFARVCKLRLHNSVQKATQELAEKISQTIFPILPIAWKALQAQDIE